MKRTIFSLLTFSILAFSGISQQEIPCGTEEALKALHTKFPQLKAEYEQNQTIHTGPIATVAEAEAKKATKYIVPVVFHILHMYGSENISDATIYSLMEELNEDYSASNAGLSNIIPMFDSIVADMEIEFRLAAIDPFGNCTNGIEHIQTHETFIGETVSKINQWDRSHYLNIWVVNEPNSGGPTQGTLLGYATFPGGTDGSGFWTDGIVLRDYTTVNTETLTHEAGHYFGLAHPFSGVSVAGAAGECGDDGIVDTPPTQGSFSVCNLDLATCDTSLVGLDTLANVQNWMDYSNCAAMFTEDQKALTHNTLEGISGQRNILWQDTTLVETGVMNATMPQTALTVPLCSPVADFNSPDRTVCTGSPVSFKDASWNAVIESRAWEFEGGTPATSTSSNPNVTWDTPGWKRVKLTVTNAAGSDTRDEVNYIYVSPDWPENVGPTTFNMETVNTWGNGTGFFIVENPEDNHGKFSVVNGYGYNGSKAFKLNTYKDISNADNFTEDWFYNFRLGGSIDNLIMPSIDLRNTAAVTVTFKFAYATNATVTADITEKLRVYTSRNCGESWTPKVVSVEGFNASSTITGESLVTAGYASNADFAPTTNTMWREASFSYSPTAQDRLTRIKFEFTASDLSSNLYIDDIIVSGILGVADQAIIDLNLVVFPNPTNGEAINVTYTAQNEPTHFILRDTQGKVVAQELIETTNTTVSKALDNTANLSAGCYFLEVKSGDHSTTQKVVVM